MIDPQGQALQWIKQKEPGLGEHDTIINLSHPNLKDAVKVPIENGWPLLIESIENEIDPMLDPLLEKQIVTKGRAKIIKISD